MTGRQKIKYLHKCIFQTISYLNAFPRQNYFNTQYVYFMKRGKLKYS